MDLKQLMNRNVFIEQIEEVLDKDRGDRYHFITTDIASFMHVNDFVGYEVRTALESESDELLIARLGGVEVSIFIKNAEHTKVLECMDAIYNAVRAFDFKAIGSGRKITIFGGMTHGNKPVHIAQMKDKSMEALLVAKRNGRDQCMVS